MHEAQRTAHARRLLVVAIAMCVALSMVAVPFGAATVAADDDPPQPPHRVYGDVVDDDGNPAAGVTVQAIDDETGAVLVEDTTDGDGYYDMDVDEPEGDSFTLEAAAGDATEDGIEWRSGSADRFDFAVDRTLEAIDLTVGQAVLERGDTTTVTVTAEYDDGSTADVTDAADLAVEDESVVSLDGDTLTAEDTGVTTVSADLGDHGDAVTVAVIEDAPVADPVASGAAEVADGNAVVHLAHGHTRSVGVSGLPAAAGSVTVFESDSPTGGADRLDRNVATYLDIAADVDVDEDVGIEVTIDRSTLANAGVDEDRATLYHWTGGEWQALDSAADVDDDTVTIEATAGGLSPFAVSDTDEEDPDPAPAPGAGPAEPDDPEANFEVDDLDPEELTVDEGETIEVSATVTNTGDSGATGEVQLQFDGEAVASQDVTLLEGDSEKVTFTVDAPDEAGEYTHAVVTADDEAAGSLTVEAVETPTPTPTETPDDPTPTETETPDDPTPTETPADPDTGLSTGLISLIVLVVVVIGAAAVYYVRMDG